MKTTKSSRFIFLLLFVFAFAAIPAFAQRGGGSHGGGGGFHGGGGGGFRSSGGSFGGGFRGGASSAPRMNSGFSRGPSSAPAAGYAGRSGGNVSRPSGPANMGQRAAGTSSAPPAVADGNWHSFGGGAAGRGAQAAGTEARGTTNTGGSWRAFSGNRSASAGAAGATRTFSGQGHDVWENTPVSHNVVSSSRALNNVHGSFNQSPIAGPVGGSSGFRTSTSAFGSSRIATNSTFGNRMFAGSSTVRFGNAYYGYRGGFYGGCWNCGYRFGFGWGGGPGWGYGWPWLGYWNWGLYWNNPWWGWPGYGYSGYPPGYVYGYPYADNYSNSAPPDDYPDANSSAPAVNQNSSQTVSAANSAAPVLLYMKDGAVDSVRDYWISGGQIHYILLNGAESAVDMDQLDVQRTVDENAKSGVQFILKPTPSSFGTAPVSPPAATPAPARPVNLTLAAPVNS